MGAEQDPSEAASGVVQHYAPAQGERYGDYEVIKPLTSGGMADIFLARKLGAQGFQKLVVIKRVRRELGADNHMVDMFIDEAHLAAKLDHPNVVVITDLGEIDNSYYMAMEYLRGQTLRSLQIRIEEQNKMVPPAFWCRVMEYALDGLNYAHDLKGDDGATLNLVHRDFTPSNIMITYKGTVKVIDFGVARVEAPKLHQTRVGAITGKISYLSPEQCMARPLDRRSDVFAAGIVLWELLSRRRLFDGPAETAIILAVMNDPIPLPGWEGQPIDEELQQIVMKALERDLSKRWQSAAEMRDALRAYLRKQSAKLDASDIAEVMGALFEGERAEDDKLIAVRDGSKSNPLPPRRDSSRSGQSVSKSYSVSGPDAATRMGKSGEIAPLPPQAKSKAVPIALAGVALLGVGIAGYVFTRPKPAPPPPPVIVKVEPPPPVKVEPPPPVKVEPPPPVKVEPPPENPEIAKTNEPTKTEDSHHHHSTSSSPVESTGGFGFLDFDTRPYTSVFLGHKKLGDTPLLEAKVPAGKVTLTLVNEEAGIHETYVVTVPKDGHVFKKLKL